MKTKNLRYSYNLNISLLVNPPEKEFIFSYDINSQKKIYIQDDGYSYFSDLNDKEEYGFFLTQSYLMIKNNPEIKDSRDILKISIKTSEEEIVIKRIEKLKSSNINYDLWIEFENNEYYDFDSKENDKKFIEALFANLGIKSMLDIKIKDNKMFLKYSSLKKFKYELFQKIINPNFIANFYLTYMRFILKELKNIKDKNNDREYIRQLNFNLAIYNFIYTRIANYKTETILKEFNIERQNIFRIIDNNKKLKDFFLNNDKITLRINEYLKLLTEKIVLKNKSNKFIRKVIRNKIDVNFSIRGEFLLNKDIEGVVKVIDNPDDLKNINKDEILVMSYPDIDSPYIVKKINGIISESGGFTNEAAMSCIKFKKLFVSGVTGCKNVFSNGEKIKTINGLIYKI